MGCPCHGNSRINAEVVFAQEQCLYCALKHLTIAWTLFTEYGYEDLNLASIDGNLRLAIQHLQYIEKDFCQQIRNIAVNIEKRRFDEVTNEKFIDCIKYLQTKIKQKFPEGKDS